MLTILLILAWDAVGIGQARYVKTAPLEGSFPIVHDGVAASISVDAHDHPGVVRAAADLGRDIARVTGVSPAVGHEPETPAGDVILIGTIGRSALIDQLIEDGTIDAAGIRGEWEATLVQVVRQPWPGVNMALVIAGSDKRGTIYGIYDLSEQIGVSPWHWWADVPVRRQEALFANAGRHLQGPPAVQYRGIFLNDEYPALGGWAHEKFGGLNHRFYTNVFELILRLKGNFLWPAMWNDAFAADDPMNPKLADEYGVVMGTSHHEPMMRAWKEWARAGNPPGSWDYTGNAEQLRTYWTDGVERVRDYEKVVTLAMRGDGDEPMTEEANIALLEEVVTDQRTILEQVLETPITAVPQVWALYKEVQGYYEKGMRVPDDVILLWADDNWGNIRRLPTARERQRSGGAGVYYHFDYVGGPRSHKWLNTTPIPKIWEQMHLAYRHGANRIWVVNVGDLKPMEFPIEFFLTFAWDPSRWPKERLREYTKLWAAREFGPEHASEIASIISKYTKYNGRRKPELLEPGTFSLEHYAEADRVLAEWKTISDQAESIYADLPGEARDAFYQLVLYPTKASATLNELYIAVARNRFYAKHQDGRANAYAARARELFQQDAQLARYYNRELAGGKWNHMMDQTHIGYSHWQQPESNTMPRVVEITNAISPLDQLALPRQAEPPRVNLPGGWSGFLEVDGSVSMEAEHFTAEQSTDSARWEVLPDHGRTLSGVTVFPVTAKSVTPPQNSPRLDYRMWLTSTGSVEVTLILSPCLNIDPDRGVRIAVSMDDERPQILEIVPHGYRAGEGNLDWEDSVKNSVRQVRSKHLITTAGSHTLKVWMVDPAVVLQKLVVDCGGVKPSYLGPPESPRHSAAHAPAN